MSKDLAPTACPKCGEERGWRCCKAAGSGGEPQHPVRESLKEGFFHSLAEHLGLLGLLGLAAACAVRSRETVTYRCDRCGYEEEYDPD